MLPPSSSARRARTGARARRAAQHPEPGGERERARHRMAALDRRLAVLVLDQRHDVAAARRRSRVHAPRRSEQRGDEVEVVHHQVHERPARARRRRASTRSSRAASRGGERWRPAAARARRSRAPGAARRSPAGSGARGRPSAARSLTATAAPDRVGILERQRHRLLEQHVAARRQRTLGHRAVQRRRQADVDGVDARPRRSPHPSRSRPRRRGSRPAGVRPRPSGHTRPAPAPGRRTLAYAAACVRAMKPAPSSATPIMRGRAERAPRATRASQR